MKIFCGTFSTPTADDDPGIRTLVLAINSIGNIRSTPIVFLYAYLLRKITRPKSNDLKLVGIILFKKCIWDTHQSKPILWYVCDFIYVDGIQV